MIKIYLTDLAKYTEGELHGKWVTLPVDDVEETIKSICGENEWFITDYNVPEGMGVSEYENIHRLNNLALEIEELEEFEKEGLKHLFKTRMFNGYDYTYEDAVQMVKDSSFSVFEDCDSMGDVAREILEIDGTIEMMRTAVKEYENKGSYHKIPEEHSTSRLLNYFDFDAYGRELDITGKFYYVGNQTYIQLHD